MLKKVRKKQQMLVNGGYHYHWMCDINRFVSARYDDINKCSVAMRQHAEKYGHRDHVSIFKCSGNCN